MESKGHLVPAAQPRAPLPAKGGWLSRLLGSTSGTPTSIRHVLSALQDAITRAAAGAARTSTRLGSVSGQIKRSNEALGEMLDTTGRLNEDIRRIAASSNETRESAAEMNQVTSEGRALSIQGAATSARLESQMKETVERIERLV